jgi:hypothetical protein
VKNFRPGDIFSWQEGRDLLRHFYHFILLGSFAGTMTDGSFIIGARDGSSSRKNAAGISVRKNARRVIR